MSSKSTGSFEIDTAEFTINVGKARATASFNDTKQVWKALEAEEEGLALQLMTFPVTEVKANLSLRQFTNLTSISYGARTFTVKAK